MYSRDGVYFVTARTMQARLLLRPSTETNELVGGVLARAVERHGIELFGYVFTSNHLHLLVRARDGSLSRFMQYLKGNIALKVGRLVDWSGAFWERRFSAEPVLDDLAMVGRLRYILAHGVKEGLVRRVEEWPGLSCASQLLGGAVRRFKWFNWAKRWLKGKLRADSQGLLDERYSEDVQLQLSVLPAWLELTPEQRVVRVRFLIEDIERAGSQTQRSPTTPEVLLQQEPHTRPAKKKKSPRPPWLCHTSFRQLRDEFAASYRAFVAQYRRASERFRSGEFGTEFPPLAFRPVLTAPTPAPPPQRYKASGT